MSDYILVIDTETSDKPRKWQASTQQVNKWPYILQIAWVICNNKGDILETRDFYIYPGEKFEINKDSFQLHNITKEFLLEKGLDRTTVLSFLADDIRKYSPMIVGHFLRFDLKMLEVSFNRAGLQQNFKDQDKFCTMYYSRPKAPYTHQQFQRLDELYYSLFDKHIKNYHNALADTLATKACFFKLLNDGNITNYEKKAQAEYFNTYKKAPVLRKLILPIILALIFIILFLLFFSV